MRSPSRVLIGCLVAAAFVSCQALPRRPGRRMARRPAGRAPKRLPQARVSPSPRARPAATPQAAPEVETAAQMLKAGRIQEAKMVLQRFLASARPKRPEHVRRARRMIEDIAAGRVPPRIDSDPNAAAKRALFEDYKRGERLFWSGQYAEAKKLFVALPPRAQSLRMPLPPRLKDYLEQIDAKQAGMALARSEDRARLQAMHQQALAAQEAGRLYQARDLLARLYAERSKLSDAEQKSVAEELAQTDREMAKPGFTSADPVAAAPSEPPPAAPKDSGPSPTQPAAASAVLSIAVTNPRQPVCTVNTSVLYLMGVVRSGNKTRDVTVIHNGAEATARGAAGMAAGPGEEGTRFTRKLALAEGLNVIEITATDGRSQVSQVLKVTYSLQEAPLFGSSWAVVIGVNRYQKEPWSAMELTYAGKDAMDMAQLLHERMDFAKDHITLLLDSDLAKEHARFPHAGQVKPATLANITRCLAALDAKRVKPDDRVLVFFAGHGHTLDLATGGEMGFLIPEDGGGEGLGDYFTSALPMQRLRELADIVPARHVLFLVDACYSGLCTTERRGLPASTSQYVRKVAKLQVRQIITAGLKDEQVQESSRWGNSAFTTKVKEALTTGAADANSDGYITGSELGQYLKPAVSTLTNGAQTPKLGCFFGDGEFLFTVKEPR